RTTRPRRDDMTRAEMTDRELEELADRAAPLDALLVDAALGPMRRLAPNSSTVRFAARLARHPVATGRRLGSCTPTSSTWRWTTRWSPPARQASSGYPWTCPASRSTPTSPPGSPTT